MGNLAGVLRVILFGVGAFFLYRYFMGDESSTEKTPIVPEQHSVPEVRRAYEYCDLWSEHFHATLTSRGATLTHFRLLSAKYKKRGEGHDLSTTPHPGVPVGGAVDDPAQPGDHEFRQQLFAQWRNPTVPGAAKADYNVAFDSVDYEVVTRDSKRCEFVYRDDDVELRKVVAVTPRPYEVEVTSSIKNLSDETRKHAYAIDTVAWWLNDDVAGKMFRVSPFITQVECMPQEGDAKRMLPTDFEPGDFDQPEFEKTGLGWFQPDVQPTFVSVSNAYFSHAIVPIGGNVEPVCQLQIEARLANGRSSDPASGAFYRARLAYPELELPPGGEASYQALSYVGPKEREILGGAANGEHRLIDLIDLGFFAAIAKVLVEFLLFVHGIIPNWGIAIIVLTITARVLLFPLTLPSIRNMIKMRELKPELDVLNERYKDDPRAKGVAMQEIWKKHGVNPFKGCLPQLASMPVWFALYTTLQTAVELYNIPFLWFPDLSESDPYFILPFVIGAVFFLQQKLMPMQGGDPMQQKMMMYFMPAMFTVFMLFLPAGLGVYMFTNSLLHIVQQQVVERQVRQNSVKQAQSEVASKIEKQDIAAHTGAAKSKKKPRKKG